MLKIRLSRTGKKRQPSYRVVVADINSKRDGRIVERIGHYNPLTDPSEFAIKEDRALHWLSVGAQPTDAVRRLLDKQGTLDRLGRMHAGESFDALVAEASDVAVAAPAAVEEVAEVEETVEEEESVVEQAVEAIEDAAAEVVDTVEDAVETAVEAVEEVVSDSEEDAGNEVADDVEEDAGNEEAGDAEEDAGDEEESG